jgi:hypothetical protein
VNNENAIRTGALAKKSMFLGTATSETTLRSNSHSSGWNNDYARSLATNISLLWVYLGSRSAGVGPGVFGFSGYSGDVNVYTSHRTILSGY